MNLPSNRVSLREINANTVRAVTQLEVTSDQRKFVAPNAVSLSEALFSPEAWYRAIYNDDDLVGFVMLYDETLGESPPASPELAIWRFMIDARYQGRGFGREALRHVIEHARRKVGVEDLLVSYVPGVGDPELFYRKLGFEPTGEIDDGEVVLSMRVV